MLKKILRADIWCFQLLCVHNMMWFIKSEENFGHTDFRIYWCVERYKPSGNSDSFPYIFFTITTILLNFLIYFVTELQGDLIWLSVNTSIIIVLIFLILLLLF